MRELTGKTNPSICASSVDSHAAARQYHTPAAKATSKPIAATTMLRLGRARLTTASPGPTRGPLDSASLGDGTSEVSPIGSAMDYFTPRYCSADRSAMPIACAREIFATLYA